jgi:A/G-specific adenine glycosylase
MESLLPHDEATARLANAGMMELGQTVCTARAPACERCPLAELCAWRAAGHPAYTGPAAPRQKPYAGSDREVRGRILHELRADELPVPAERIAGLWPDAEQLARALDGLLADGLAEAVEGGYALPSG